MSEIVRDIGAGLVVKPSPEGIEAGLKSLLSDPVLSRAMGAIGREHVIANYGWPSVARRMEGGYTARSSRRTDSRANERVAAAESVRSGKRNVGWSSSPIWLPPDFGAVGQYMQMRARSLAERGHDVTLVGLSSAGSSVKRESVSAGTLTEIRLAATPVPRTSLLGPAALDNPHRFQAAVRRVRPPARRRRKSCSPDRRRSWFIC